MLRTEILINQSTDITVVICTRNRPESLRQTLSCLERADKHGLRCEVVIVDNGSGSETADVARMRFSDLPLHYLTESQPGKSHGLNRALVGAPLGKIVAVLDDDMSPQPGWFQGVMAISHRWPETHFFTGRSYVIWPKVDLPEWCFDRDLLGWAFSVSEANIDEKVGNGYWFSGNHFWFRSSVLADGRRFDAGGVDLKTHIETSEPRFMLRLVEEGFGGVRAPDAACGHRIQPELLDQRVIMERAARCGRGFAEIRMRPWRRSVHQAEQFRKHPLLARGFCVMRLIKWLVFKQAARLRRSSSQRFATQLQAEKEIAYYSALLKIAAQMPEYRLRFPIPQRKH
jgi:glycosyltransferase involved in cell wall biosynthesis